VILAVDGVDHDEFANTAELYLKLHTKAGDSARLEILRDGKRLTMPLQTQILSFRK